MSGGLRLALTAAVVLVIFGWLGWRLVDGNYLEPKKALEQRIVLLTGQVEQFDKGVEDHARVLEALRRLAERTLGGDPETVDHRLRSRLNRIGEEIGLEELSVGTGRVRALQSPARSQFLRGQKALRDEVDVVEVEGWISGEGTFEQALRLAHRIDAEPWLKRVGQFRIQPRRKEDRFAITLRFVTLFLPNQAPPPDVPPAETADSAGFDRYAALLRRNPFRMPSPAPAPPTPPEAVQNPAPWTLWVLTGVASGPGGPEVWLLNPGSGESRRLAVGESLHEVMLVAAAGEAAEFRLHEERFTVAVGQSLGASYTPRQ